MLHILIAPCQWETEIDWNSLEEIQDAANRSKIIHVSPDNESTLFRDNLIKPLLDEDGCLKKEVYDQDSVYLYNDGEFMFYYDFAYFPYRTPPVKPSFTKEEREEIMKDINEFFARAEELNKTPNN